MLSSPLGNLLSGPLAVVGRVLEPLLFEWSNLEFSRRGYMKNHWYVVAHRAGARVFQQQGIEEALTLVKLFENPEGKVKSSDLVSDRQGRFDRGGGGHIAVGSEDVQREHIAQKFSREIASYLDSEAQKNAYNSLALVAEPQFLGELHKALGQAASSKVTKTLTKDLANVGEHQMAASLSDILLTKEPIAQPR